MLGINLYPSSKPEKPPIQQIQKPPVPYDPLAFDLNADGIVNTLAIEEGVFFDLDNTGHAESTSWVAPQDGLLALDLNNNGIIEDGAELFGNGTQLSSGNLAANGFEALQQYDENHDNKIDALDNIFNDLLIWQDLDSDGISDIGELNSLTVLDITSIDLNYGTDVFIDDNFVQHREHAFFTNSSGETNITNSLWFITNPTNSVPIEVHTGEGILVSEAIQDLPNVVGSGNVYSLHQAMSMDSSGYLQSLVEQFNTESDRLRRKTLVSQIILNWSGQTEVDPTARGEYVDAQKLAVLEAFWGQSAERARPNPLYGKVLNDTYDAFELFVYSQLMINSHYGLEMSMIVFDQIDGVINADFELFSWELQNRIKGGITDFTETYLDFLDVVSRP